MADELRKSGAKQPQPENDDPTPDSEPQHNAAGLIGDNIGKGIGTIVAGVPGAIIGAGVDYLRHRQHGDDASTETTTAAPSTTGGTQSGSTGLGGPSTDAVTHAAESHNALEEAQRAREQQYAWQQSQDELAAAQQAREEHATEVAAAKKRRRDLYNQQMAEQDAARAAEHAEADAQSRSLGEAHRARGEHEFLSNDEVAAADDQNEPS
jgi:hypothetical protein